MSGAGASRAAPEPTVLALAGLDPSGRAGLLADVATIRASGGVAQGIATALTAQGPQTFATSAVPLRMLGAQIRAVLELGRIDAVKLGMVPDARALRAICAELQGLKALWVVDPVTWTSSGERLSRLKPTDYLALANQRVTITPNLLEAAWLLGTATPLRTVEQAAHAGRELVCRGFGAVIIKGGHRGDGATDVVCQPGAVLYLEGRRLRRSSARHRGTGCRFASALATALVRGRTMADAAWEAKEFVAR